MTNPPGFNDYVFEVDSAYTYGSHSHRNEIVAAIDNLSADASMRELLKSISDHLASINVGKFLITTAPLIHTGVDGPYKMDNTGFFYFPGNDPNYGSSLKYGTNTDPTVSHPTVAVAAGDAVMILQDSGSDSPFDSMKFTSYDASVGLFSPSLERVIFHEMVHALVNAGRPNSTSYFNFGHIYDDGGTTGPYDYKDDYSISFGEDISVFAENFLYLPYAKSIAGAADAHVRYGHVNSPDSNRGASGIFAFDDFNLNRRIDAHLNAVITPETTVDFIGTRADGATLKMAYHQSGYRVSGVGNSGFSYDHYLTYQLDAAPNHSLIRFDQNGTSIDSSVIDVMRDSLVAPGTGNDYNIFSSISLSSKRLASFDEAVSETGIHSLISSILSSTTSGPKALTTISAETHLEYESGALFESGTYLPISGPVTASFIPGNLYGGTPRDLQPPVLAIDARGNAEASLILGGSGYTGFVKEGTNSLTTSPANFSNSSDLIMGSSKSDVIVTGTGTGNTPNAVYGGEGHDIISGRGGNDILSGEGGSDLLIGGKGTNTLNGGGGFDFASYADQNVSLTINTVSGQVNNSDYSIFDNLTDIEAVIGGSGQNTFYGNGKTVLIGGAGDDTFILKPGDVVFGGGGRDTYILSQGKGMPTVTERYAIMDLDSNDQIFAPYQSGMNTYAPYTYEIHHDIREGQPDRISAEVQSYNVTMPAPGTTGTPVTTLGPKWIAYEIYTNDGTVASPFDFSFPSNVDVYDARGQYDFSRIFDLRPAGVTGSALSDRLIMTDASPSGIYDSGGGQDIASYEKKYWGGFYSGITVSVESNGIVNSYLVDTGAAQHEFRGYAGIEGTAFDDTFEITSIAGTSGTVTGGDGRDLISLANAGSGYVVDLDNSRITYQGTSLSYSGMNRIDLGSGNTLAHSGSALDQGTDIILRAGIHSIDLVEGMHLRPAGYDAKVTVNVQAAYDPSFNLANVLASGGANSFYSSTALSTVDGGNTHIVFNETFSGTMTITQDYGGFLRLGNVFFRQISDVFFEADAIDLDLSGLAYNGYGNTLYGAHEHSKIIGSGSRDTIYGRGAMGDELHGGAGDDVIYASDSGSLLFGDSGNDWLYGGEGDDQIHSGTGYDYLMGRGGNDTFFFEGASGGSVSGNKMTTSPEGLDSGFDTVNFDFAFSDVISITSTVYTQIGTPTFDTLATEIQTIHGTFSLFDCDWMTFAGQNGMAITPTYDYHI